MCVASAEDAFGTSVGNERVGLYNPSSARGFSPIVGRQCADRRLVFRPAGPLPERLVASSTMRVGLTAQSYPFPAPTGIADFALAQARRTRPCSAPQRPSTLSAVCALEVDGQAADHRNARRRRRGQLRSRAARLWRGANHPPGGDRPALAAQRYHRDHPLLEHQRQSGRRRSRSSSPTAPSFRPGSNDGSCSARTWADNEIALSQLRPALDRPQRRVDLPRRAVPLADRQSADLSRLSLNTDRRRRGRPLHHRRARPPIRLHLGRAARVAADLEGERQPCRPSDRARPRATPAVWRQPNGVFRPIGIDEPPDRAAPPDFTFGPQTARSRTAIHSWTWLSGAVARGRRAQPGHPKNLLSRSAASARAGRSRCRRTSPWLMNGTLSIYASRRSSSTPAMPRAWKKARSRRPSRSTATKRRRRSSPSRWTPAFGCALARNLRLVAGLFDVRKPYFALDGDLFYRNLGELRNRGLEVSLAGRITPRAERRTRPRAARFENQRRRRWTRGWSEGARSIQCGALRQRRGGLFSRPGWTDYRSTCATRITAAGPADRLNRFYIPARHVVSVGGRYRFRIGDAPATLRAQIASITNHFCGRCLARDSSSMSRGGSIVGLTDRLVAAGLASLHAPAIGPAQRREPRSRRLHFMPM